MGCGSSSVHEPSKIDSIDETKKQTSLKPAVKIERLTNLKRCETIHKTPPMNEDLWTLDINDKHFTDCATDKEIECKNGALNIQFKKNLDEDIDIVIGEIKNNEKVEKYFGVKKQVDTNLLNLEFFFPNTGMFIVLFDINKIHFTYKINVMDVTEVKWMFPVLPKAFYDLGLKFPG